MSTVFHSYYLPPVGVLAEMLSEPAVVFDYHEHYIKQTLRSRCMIVGANGVQTLTVPVELPNGSHTPMRDVRISSHGGWNKVHWQSIRSAYENSPFFEYLADDFAPLYEQPPQFLIDFNEKLLRVVVADLDLDVKISCTEQYTGEAQTAETIVQPRPYYQVFAQKHGFMPNMSCIDLLFNMGHEGVFCLLRRS